MDKEEKRLTFRDRAAWRKWLKKHHADEDELWLVYHKKHTGRECIPYEDSVEEALCFGWIDSILKKLDEDTYARKFTPRRENSVWSELNRERARRMAASRRMTRAGMKKIGFPLNGPVGNVKKRPKSDPVFSDGLFGMLRANKKAWIEYGTLSPSQRRNCVGWVMSAKREETRLRRMRELIDILARGERLGMK
jgi:uncharacterized protein YdeI (YjbR/CyaY-like superfamily)